MEVVNELALHSEADERGVDLQPRVGVAALHVPAQLTGDGQLPANRPARPAGPARPGPAAGAGAGRLNGRRRQQLGRELLLGRDPECPQPVLLIRKRGRLAVDETVILLHPPLPLVGVSIVMERERQPNDSAGHWLRSP